MYTEIKHETMPDGTRLSDFRGLSTDDKPTDGVCNGSSYLEMDTGFTSYFCGEKTETTAYGEGHTGLATPVSVLSYFDYPYIGFDLSIDLVQTMFYRATEQGDADGLKFILNENTYDVFYPTGDNAFYMRGEGEETGFACEKFTDPESGDSGLLIQKPDGSVFTETISIQVNEYVITGEGDNEYVTLGTVSPKGGAVISGSWTESEGD